MLDAFLLTSSLATIPAELPQLDHACHNVPKFFVL